MFSVYIPSIFLKGSPSIARLWPNFKAIETDYFRRTGIFPVMHIVAIRQDVHREHPFVAARLYKAFCAARDAAVAGLYDSDALHLTLPFLLDHVEEARRVFGDDFWAYGVGAEPSRLRSDRALRARAGARAPRGGGGGGDVLARDRGVATGA